MEKIKEINKDENVEDLIKAMIMTTQYYRGLSKQSQKTLEQHFRKICKCDKKDKKDKKQLVAENVKRVSELGAKILLIRRMSELKFPISPEVISENFGIKIQSDQIVSSKHDRDPIEILLDNLENISWWLSMTLAYTKCEKGICLRFVD